MFAPNWAATSGSRPELITATYRRLQRMGFDDSEAANLTALTNGFAIGSQPWTVRELTHLLFVRVSNGNRGRWSNVDDRAEPADRAPVSAGADAPAAADTAPSLVATTADRSDADPSNGPLTLLTLFRSMAGRNATLDLLRPPTGPRLDAGGDVGGEGG